jgi:hypothetical protein
VIVQLIKQKELWTPIRCAYVLRAIMIKEKVKTLFVRNVMKNVKLATDQDNLTANNAQATKPKIKQVDVFVLAI